MKRFLKSTNQVKKRMLFSFVAAYLLLITTVVMTEPTNAYFTSQSTIDGQMTADSEFAEEEQAKEVEDQDNKNKETEQDQIQDEEQKQDKRTEEDTSNEDKSEQEKASGNKTDEQQSSTNADVSEQNDKQKVENDPEETS